MMGKVTAIIVAAGSGKRMQTSCNKQYIMLDNKEVLAHTLDIFNKCPCVDDIIVVVVPGDTQKVQKEICEKYGYHKVTKIIAGGKERQDSVYNGLLSADHQTDFVIIHDGARPFVTNDIILNCFKAAKKHGASIAAVPVKDTIKVCNPISHKVEMTPDRKTLWNIQTPQVFNYKLLMDAYHYACENNIQATDDSMLVEHIGHEVYLSDGSYTNIKITTQEDLIIAESILKSTNEIV